VDIRFVARLRHVDRAEYRSSENDVTAARASSGSGTYWKDTRQLPPATSEIGVIDRFVIPHSSSTDVDEQIDARSPRRRYDPIVAASRSAVAGQLMATTVCRIPVPSGERSAVATFH